MNLQIVVANSTAGQYGWRGRLRFQDSREIHTAVRDQPRDPVDGVFVFVSAGSPAQRSGFGDSVHRQNEDPADRVSSVRRSRGRPFQTAVRGDPWLPRRSRCRAVCVSSGIWLFDVRLPGQPMPHVERLNHGTVTQDQNENAERLPRPCRNPLRARRGWGWSVPRSCETHDSSLFLPIRKRPTGSLIRYPNASPTLTLTPPRPKSASARKVRGTLSSAAPYTAPCPLCR